MIMPSAMFVPNGVEELRHKVMMEQLAGGWKEVPANSKSLFIKSAIEQAMDQM